MVLKDNNSEDPDWPPDPRNQIQRLRSTQEKRMKPFYPTEHHGHTVALPGAPGPAGRSGSDRWRAPTAPPRAAGSPATRGCPV